MTTEKSKTKCVSFRTSSELMNEITSLSESKNILKSHFIQNLINDYFKTEPTIFNYYEIVYDSKKVHSGGFRLPNKIYDKINDICVSLDITKSAFLNYLLYELLLTHKGYETDNLKELDKKKEDRKTILNRIYNGFFHLYYNRKNKTPISNETNEQKDIPDKSYSKQINEPVMKMINTEFIEQCNDEIKIETDSSELNEINYLNRIKKRGRPSKAQIINQTISDNRKINSFSELKLNDTIYFISDDFEQIENGVKQKRINHSVLKLPYIQKIKIYSIETKDKCIFINRKSLDFNNFEIKLSLDEYYEKTQVYRENGFYSCSKTTYEDVKEKIKMVEIKIRMDKIKRLNVEIEILKKM
jgi:hypothetical protein